MKKAFEMEEGEYLATSYEERENGFLSSPTWRKRGANYRRRSAGMELFCARGGKKMQLLKTMDVCFPCWKERKEPH